MLLEAVGRAATVLQIKKQLVMDFLKSHPEIVVVSTYSDDGFSGVNFERPEFQRMLSDIREDKIDCVIVKDLSRFGRNYIDPAVILRRFFRCWGSALLLLLMDMTVSMRI